jgi:hypothetical protein
MDPTTKCNIYNYKCTLALDNIECLISFCSKYILIQNYKTKERLNLTNSNKVIDDDFFKLFIISQNGQCDFVVTCMSRGKVPLKRLNNSTSVINYYKFNIEIIESCLKKIQSQLQENENIISCTRNIIYNIEGCLYVESDYFCVIIISDFGNVYKIQYVRKHISYNEKIQYEFEIVDGLIDNIPFTTESIKLIEQNIRIKQNIDIGFFVEFKKTLREEAIRKEIIELRLAINQINEPTKSNKVVSESSNEVIHDLLNKFRAKNKNKILEEVFL